MKKKTVADLVIEMMKKENLTRVCWDMYEFLDEVADEAKKQGISNIYDKHPLDRHILILNRLERDKRFTKYLYKIFTGAGRGGQGEQWVRQFELKSSLEK